jgi:hypothetical protein
MVKMLRGRSARLALLVMMLGFGAAIMPATAASASTSSMPATATVASVAQKASVPTRASGWSVTQAPLDSLALRGPAFRWVEAAPVAVPHQLGPVSMRTLGQCIGGSGHNYCIWDYVNFTGGFYDWGSEWNGMCVPIGAPFNNQMESAYNNMSGGGWKMKIFDGSGCSGTVIAIFGFGDFGSSFNGNNNKASSFRTYV